MRYQLRAVAAALAVASPCLAATGCWNAIPIGHRALIQIVTVDAARHGNTLWTFFQANPTALASMGSGVGAGPGGGTASDQVLPLAVVAPTLGAAYRRAQEMTSRDLYLGQLQQIVLSESLGPAAVRAALDAFAHTPELDQSQALFAAPGSAANTILARDPQELFPAAYLDHVTACPTCNTTAIHLSLMDAFLATRTAWGAMIMPEVTTSRLGLAVSGAVVYEGARLVSRASPDDTALLGLITGQTVKTSLETTVPGLGTVSVRSLRGTVHLRARWRDGLVEAAAVSHVTGQLVGLEPDRGLRFERDAPIIDQAVSSALVQRVGGVVARIMAAGGDPLDLGRALWAGDPSAAPSPAAWRYGLSHGHVQITVHTAITSQGVVR